MRSRALWGCCVMLFLASVAGRAFAQDRALTTTKVEEDRTVRVEPAAAEGGESQAPIVPVPLPPDLVFERHAVLAPGADVTAGVTEQLIFSNTLGTFGAALGANRLVADDITTTVPGSCKLRRYEFPVVGKVDPAGIGGPYTIDFAMYSSCPQSVPTASRPGLIIPGTSVTALNIPDDAPRLISFTAGANVPLPTNFWFGVKFSRGNAGVVVGTPPMTGFSCDQYDFPGFPCNADLGGFPGQPQTSFNLEIYSDSECANSFTAYKNHKPSGSIYNSGAHVLFADDIQLSSSGCRLVGYEVAIKGVGFYEFEIRNSCEGGTIAGTQKTWTIGSGTDTQIARFTFANPIPIPQNFWFATRVNNSTGGVVISGKQACIGRTEDLLGVLGEVGDCTIVDVAGAGLHAGFDLAITCAGAAPVGACCDMFITDENGDGVCRQVPQTNCPFPPRFSASRPVWVQGEACEPDPFQPEACGKAACCTPDGGCQNLTQDECYAVPPLDSERQWQLGRYCNSQGQRCPRIACLARTGECTLPRVCPPECPPTGCENPLCCTDVCNQDNFCCDVEWDDVCASYARELCDIPPDNDVCAPDGDLGGARLMTDVPPSTAETDSGRATTDDTDPGFGCYVDNFGATGLQTVWYKFVATGTSALLQTCNSNSPADDSLLGVFAVGDPSTPVTQCSSLTPVACDDDRAGCSDTGKNSKICARPLIPGNLYYVMVAAKFAEDPGKAYRLDISAPCTQPVEGSINNYCPGAVPIGQCQNATDDDSDTKVNDGCPAVGPAETGAQCSNATDDDGDGTVNDGCPAVGPAETDNDGTTAFSLAPESMDPPVESCIPTMTVDVWYNYSATCTGILTVETCGSSPGTTPDTNLAIYDSGVNGECLCPPMTAAPVCSTDAGGNCGLGSRVQVDVVEGNCYKIRLADSAENRPSGNLKISCLQADCPAGAITFTVPPGGVVDAARPHDPNNAAVLQGINTIKATGPRDALASCFSLCETAISGSPNSIAGVVEGPSGTYTITLTRPITGGALTTITYTDTHLVTSTGRFASHPGNVKGDATASATDAQDLLNVLNGTDTLTWGNYSGDVNRSGGVSPADILEVVDLLNGAGAYIPWNGTANPSTSTACPPP